MVKKSNWQAARLLTPEKKALARLVLEDLRQGGSLGDALRRHPTANGHLSKSTLVAVYRELTAGGEWQADPELLERIRLKPVRTLSGVTTVTVLTKPHPCPGECIFCPSEARMPKSYLPDEPGAMRGLDNQYDARAQVTSRLQSLQEVGHPTDKIELLILGGTFTSYPPEYQESFVQDCFEAMNGRAAGSLEKAQLENEQAAHRNVGFSIETRPDEIDARALQRLRWMGVTKVQIGVQSLDDRILEKNRRGHDAARACQAAGLLRAAGFKVVAHWMPNLLGATPASDREDFRRLWQDLCPDEIKIYPTQLLAGTRLFDHWQKGEYQPYSTEMLIDLLADVKQTVPRYCRVNRVIRDIPSTHVVAGNRRTSLRQDVQAELRRKGKRCECIRCREVRSARVVPSRLKLDQLAYPAGNTREHFLSFVTEDDRLAGFLRLSLPGADAPRTGMPELDGAALVREVHVYGQSLPVGSGQDGAAQHIGLGTRLLEAAEAVGAASGFRKLAVIAAVGTRRYYLDRGYERGEYYLIKKISR